jgi:hypothetical protein
MCCRSVRAFLVLVALMVAVSGCALARKGVPAGTPALGTRTPTAAPTAGPVEQAPTASAPTASAESPAGREVQPIMLLAPDLKTPVEGTFEIAWEAVPGATGYNVSIVDLGTSELFLNQAVAGTSLQVTRTLKPGHGYLLGVDGLGSGMEQVARFAGEFKAAGKPVPVQDETTQQLPAGCDRKDLPAYIDRAARLCFAYPQGFTLAGNAGTQAAAEIRGPAIGTGPEPLFASLSLEFWPYQGQELSAFVDELLKTKVPAGYPAKVERKQITFGGHAAEVLEPVPGRLSSRVVVVDAAPQGYHILMFWPSFKDAPAGQMTADAQRAQHDMETLYETVTSTFSGLPPAGVPVDPAATSAVTGNIIHGAAISLSADPAVIQKITAQAEKAVLPDGNSNYPDWHPVQARFGFEGYAGGKAFSAPFGPQVLVYRAADIRAFGMEDHPDGYTAQAAALQKLLKDRPDLARFAGLVPLTATNEGVPLLPFLPTINARQELIVQPAYVKFNGGEGIRYITAFIQSVDQLNYQSRLYTFQGITDDGEYYISAVFPIAGDTMPKIDMTRGPDTWLPALQDAIKASNSLPPDRFEPSLALLDKLVASITIAPVPAGSQGMPAMHRSTPYEDIVFAYPGIIAEAAIAQTVPAAGSSDVPWWIASPRHVEFGFNGYAITQTAIAPQMAVYPVDAFVAVNQEAAKRIAALKDLLKYRPESVEGELPFLPLWNAKQAMHAQMKYLVFQNGEGIGYLTQYGQGPAALNNQELFYTFQGLTFDGKYYVAAILPAHSGLLPGTPESVPAAERDAVAGDYAGYLKNMAAKLDAQGNADFKPALDDLATLVESIRVKQIAPVPSSSMLPYRGINFVYGPQVAVQDEAVTVPATGSSDAAWWTPSPEHVEIGLRGYPIAPGAINRALVSVYPVAEFSAANQEAGKRIAALQELLKSKPADPAGDLPYVPLLNAKQQIHARVKYLPFGHGEGMAYLTQYGQGLTAVNNQELVYTFQGLTADGKYYVSAVFPVSTAALPTGPDGLPASDAAAMAKDYAAYLKDVTAKLDAEPDAAYTPNLAALDAVVGSIHVKP